MHGLWPAILKPLAADGSLDIARTLAHCRHLLAAGCDGVTLFGTTGEGPAFTFAERTGLLDALLAGGLRPDQIAVTTTASALEDAIALGRHASARGCHRQLYMPPYYFRNPPESGIVECVSAVVRGIGDPRLKVLLYHIPALSSVPFSHDAIRTLVQRHPGVVIGAKDSSGDRTHGLALAKAFPELSILVGAEQYVADVMQVGGSGSINGLGNIAPALMARIVAAPASVAPEDTRLVQDLLALLSVRPDMNFVAVYKTMLAERTGDDAWLRVRLPLLPLAAEEARAVRAGLRAIGDALARL